MTVGSRDPRLAASPVGRAGAGTAASWAACHPGRAPRGRRTARWASVPCRCSLNRWARPFPFTVAQDLLHADPCRSGVFPQRAFRDASAVHRFAVGRTFRSRIRKLPTCHPLENLHATEQRAGSRCAGNQRTENQRTENQRTEKLHGTEAARLRKGIANGRRCRLG